LRSSRTVGSSNSYDSFTGRRKKPPEPGQQQPLRRTTVDIYADILEVVKRHGGYGRVTRISYGVGMPVDRLKKFLDRLEKFGLVQYGQPAADDDGTCGSGGVTYLLTQRGQEFLDTYWRMKGFLEVLGGTL
jgi:predicted transcriptional regulator